MSTRKEGWGPRVFQPSSARRGVGKKNIGNKGEACRSVECIGRAVLLQRRTAVCNHVDFYGILYYREIYGEEREKRRLYGRLSCDYSRSFCAGEYCSQGAFAPAIATFIALFIALLNSFFPPEKHGEEAVDRFLK